MRRKDDYGEDNSYGIISLVLGVSSIMLFWIPFIGLLLSIIGIILYSKQQRKYPNGIATLGLIACITGLVISIIYLLVWAIIIMAVIRIFSTLFGMMLG